MRDANQNEAVGSGSKTAKKDTVQKKQAVNSKESKENIPRKRIQIDEINEDEVVLVN